MQGASSAGMWDLSSQLPEARVTVGSGPEAGWNVQAPDVMPLHFEFYWDGTSLWVGPPIAGTLTADGEPVMSWRQLTGRTRLEFGRAAMLVESSQSIEVEAAIATAPLAPSTGDFVEGDATAIFEEQPVAFGGSAALTTAPLEPDATRVLEPEAHDAIPRPGFGGGPAAVGAVGHGSAGGPVAAPRELKTQILDTEALGIGPSVPPPAPSPPAPSPIVPGVGPGSGPVGDSRPTLLGSDMSTDILSLGDSAPRPREVVGPGGAKFALPPIDDGAAPTSTGPTQLKNVPTRTWILLGVTLVAALGAILLGAWKKQQQQQALAAEVAAQQQAQTQQAQAHADLLRERIRADAERLQRERERLVALVEGDISEAVEAARERALEALGPDATEEQTEAALREASRLAIEKLAVDATVSNDLRRALGFYLRLQRDYPRPEYDGIVDALRAKLECRRGVRRDGSPCPS